jgi:hypothetical protein
MFKKTCHTWPYSLPEFLRPQAGTTYWVNHDNALETEEAAPKRIGVLQAILYGRPNPDEKNMSSFKQDDFFYKVPHGIKQSDGEEVGVAAELDVAEAKKEVEAKTMVVEVKGCIMIGK